MSASKPLVLSVGQCAMDHGNISRLLQQQFDAEVRPAITLEDAMKFLEKGGFDLVLVNRVLDANGESGLDFIKQMQSDESARLVPVMLVSNYADAQASALALGARRGFGKGALQHPATLELLAEVLSESRLRPSPGGNSR